MFLKTKYILPLSFFLLVSPLFSQDFQKDMERIVSQLEASTACSIVSSVKTYSKKGGELIYETGARVYKKGDSTRTVLGEMEFLEVNNYHIRLDHEEKAVLIFDKTKNQPSTNMAFSKKDMQSIQKTLEGLQQNSTGQQDQPVYKLVADDGRVRTYSATKIPGVKAVTIQVNYQQHKLVSISYEYGTKEDPGNYILVTYSEFLYTIKEEGVFDLTKLFSVQNGKYILSPKYKQYHLYTEL